MLLRFLVSTLLGCCFAAAAQAEMVATVTAIPDSQHDGYALMRSFIARNGGACEIDNLLSLSYDPINKDGMYIAHCADQSRYLVVVTSSTLMVRAVNCDQTKRLIHQSCDDLITDANIAVNGAQ